MSVHRIRSIALLVAVLGSTALVVAALLVPVYSTQSASSDGASIAGSSTLVEENGARGFIVAAIPLLVSLAVGALLRARGWRAAMPIAWGLTAMLGVFTVLGLMSVGMFIAPITVALIVACAAAS